jgi:hypothetical protein
VSVTAKISHLNQYAITAKISQVGQKWLSQTKLSYKLKMVVCTNFYIKNAVTAQNGSVGQKQQCRPKLPLSTKNSCNSSDQH